MAGGGSSKSRKRVEATPADAAATATGPSLVRAKDGSAFARWCVLFFPPYSFCCSCWFILTGLALARMYSDCRISVTLFSFCFHFHVGFIGWFVLYSCNTPYYWFLGLIYLFIFLFLFLALMISGFQFAF